MISGVWPIRGAKTEVQCVVVGAVAQLWREGGAVEVEIDFTERAAVGEGVSWCTTPVAEE